MKKTLLRVLSVICLLCCITGIGFATQNNAQADTVPTVTLQNGAWVRLSTVNAGIRFVAEIDDYSEDYTYGMYIFPTEYLDDYVSGDVVAHAKSKLAEGKKLAGGDCTPYFNEDEGGYRINGVLVNLHYGNLNREFVAVAYVRSGDNYTYSDVSVSRNIVWVSGASVASGKYDGQTTSLSILNNFIKLGSYQAIGASEETAEAAETLPEISVESSITVYAGLWAQPTFMYNGNPITNVFNPYVTEKDEHLSYSNHLVKGFEAGEFTVSYGDIGDCTVTVRDLDTTLNDDYYGVYSTVERITQVVTDDSPITVAEAQNAEVTLVKGTAHRGLAAGTEYDVSESGISIGGEIIETQYGVQPLNVYVLNGDAAYIYDTVYIKDYFADNTAYTSVFQYITPSGLSRDFTGDKMDIILKSNGTISGRYYATGLDIDYLKLAYVSGYDVLEFDITVDDDFAAFDGKGIRIYASRQTTGYDVGAIQAGTSGVTLYQDFGTGVTEATTFTVKIYLKEFLALDASANQLRFVISAPSGNEVYFSNFHVKMLGVEESFTKEYGFNLANSGAGGKWNTTTGGVITREYDAEKDAMKVTMLNAGAAINGRYFVLYTPIAMITEAKELGFNQVSFKVSSDNGAFTDAGRGIRIYSKANSGADGGAIDGQGTTSGVYVYGDYGTTAGTTEFTVTIDINTFIALNPSAGYIGIVMNIPQNTTAYFSDLTVSHYTAEEAFTAQYGFNSVNSKTTANGGKWDFAANGIMGISYNAAKGAMAVNMVNASAAINGRYFVMYTDISMLTDAKAAGFNTISFKVSSDNSAFTADGRGIRVFSKTNSGMDNSSIPGATGVYVYGDYGTAADTTEFTVIIDIDNFLALNENANYLGIVMNIPANTTAYFSDLTVKYTDDIEKAYGFNQTNSQTTANGGKWDVAAGGIMGKSYNAAKYAMAVNMLNANATINGRNFVMYTDISMLTDARAAGFKAISFKVWSDDGAFTADGRGIRVFSKKNSGLDGYAIATYSTAGIYVYGDYGTAASTTEFTVVIDIDDFLTKSAAYTPNYLGIVMNIPQSTTAYFSDFTAIPYTAEEVNANYGFNSANSQTTANGGKWDIAANGIMSIGYNANKNAMAVNMLNANATINGRNFVIYTDISMLIDAKAAGFNTVSFKVWSDDGAFMNDGRGIRVFSKKNSGLDGYAIATYSVAGIYVYGDYGTAEGTTEFTVVIDIDDFLTKSAAYTPNYLGIVMNIPQSTTAYFSDFTAIPYTAEEVNANYGFNSANSGKWASVAAAAIGTEWDAMSGAMKVTAKNAYDVNSRYPVIETSVSVLKEAQKAGFSTVSFKVWSDDGAFTDEGKIIRVFGKNYSGVGSYNITTDADHGIYVYGDYGSAAGTTEFTVVIDLDEFFDGCGYYSITPTYLGIAAYIPANTHAYFACMTFDGEWQTSVVIPDDYSVAERNIAEKLSETLTTALGRNVIIETESEAAANERIYLGDTDAFSALGISDFDEEHLNGDGFVIASAGNNIYIAGAIDKGTVNGVYHYLEELIGVKYYGLDAVEVPSVKNLAYPVTTITEVPDFKYRAVITDSTMHTDEAEKIYSGDVAEYYAETRQSHELSHAEDVIDTFYGGSVNLFKGINQSHNNLTYVNPTTYLGTYPSMFYVVDEKAVDICYSSGINADGTIASGTNAASVYVESLKAYITANPNVEYFMLGQEDVKTRCTCSACYTGANLYGYSADNGYAAVVLRFYNAVANEIYAWETANSRDHVKLVVFSYLFSSKAPVKSSGGSYTCHSTVALASNIVLRFADFTANQYYSFVDANQSNGYGSDYLTKWACIIGDNDVWYWGYATNHSYYFAYTPSLQKISATLTALKGIDAEYVLIQHDSYEKNDWRAQMEAYVINKMLWDRTLTATTLRDEYIDGYYGVASAKIKTFVNNFDTRMATIAGNASTREYFLYDIISVSDDTYKVEELVTKDFLLSQLAVLDEAIAAIEASELSDDEKNVLIARVNAVKVTPLFYLAYAADGYYNNSSDRTTVRSTFISLCESLGITCYGEQRYIVNLKTEWGL